MPRIIGFTLLLLILTSFSSPQPVNKGEDWGFFAHRRINELAVFTLPYEMLPLFKTNIEYLREHSVDPDKRRYATVFEAIRHYIDLDIWENQFPLDTLSKEWDENLLQFCEIISIDQGDTIQYKQSAPIEWGNEREIQIGGSYTVDVYELLDLFRAHILPQYYEEQWTLSPDTFQKYTGVPAVGEEILFIDHFSEHGVLPYHLEKMQYRLTEAFSNKDVSLILRLSAEIGHYIGDANVPLHTTENYNGQLTDQVGIHAFWESRIPELFSEDYNFFVGEARYQADKKEFFWSMVKHSHSLVDSVLGSEKRLRKEFPESQQMCFDERLGRTTLTQCKAFAKAYQKEMEGMVEDQMKRSIQAIGDAWFTAWVDAGQPEIHVEGASSLDTSFTEELPGASRKLQQRKHEN